MQIATKSGCYLIDCGELKPITVCSALRTVLENSAHTKLLHDAHGSAAALQRIGGVRLTSVFDSQIAAELLMGEMHVGLHRLLGELGAPQPGGRVAADAEVWRRRPLPADALEQAAEDVARLLAAFPELRRRLDDNGFETVVSRWGVAKACADDSRVGQVLRASALRVDNSIISNGRRHFAFEGQQMRSYSLVVAQGRVMVDTTRPAIDHVGVRDLMALLPPHVLGGRNLECIPGLSDIVLDVGRKPSAFDSDERLFLREDDLLVTPDDIQHVMEAVGPERFGTDNRAGIDRSLHRISALRNRSNEVIGLTLRVGRVVTGSVRLIADILHSNKSVLILGEPGAGKTTIVREVARTLADRMNVVIVDTSNEIAGDGDVPHPCVGHARRMMVRSLAAQGSVMIECVQNHAPHVMVIDEIGRAAEVEAARTVKQRGVRMVASAHGSFRQLMKNRELRGLLGGVEQVIRPGGHLDHVRGGEPTFDVVVEVTRAHRDVWTVVLDAAEAADRVLNGETFRTQRRQIDARGLLSLEMVDG